LRAYPVPQAGFHRVFLDHGQVALTFLFGDAAAMRGALEARIDAWYLDGFAPDRNPEMWSSAVMAEIARLSKPHARLATYSVAGEVRRNLAEAGFELHRAPGFGAKREMLLGTYRGPSGSSAGRAEPPARLQPWFAHAPAARLRRGHMAVIGAGIAGCAVARAMQQRGWRVTLVERDADIAAGASGNPVGVLMPRLTAAPSLDGRTYAAAWRFGLDVLEDVADTGLPLTRDRCGALQLATDDAEAERLAAIAARRELPEPLLFHANAREASELSGVKLDRPALFFPHGGWIDPRALCRALATGAQIMTGRGVARLKRGAGVWDLCDDEGTVIDMADAVVLANATSAAAMPEARWLPLAARRGQISLVTPAPATARLHSLLVFGGYLTPAHRGVHCLGATFDWVDEAMAKDGAAGQPVAAPDHARNLDDLARALPHLRLEAGNVVDGRAGLRCVTPDHLPAVGPLPDDTAYLRDFAELRHGHPWARYPAATYQPGLYVLAGLGARGLVTAALAAEILACHVVGEPWPVERDLVAALHPGRFLVRDLKRLAV
jgi:tRNA 5-methylaminomethyl-2-thiouridine biosynthesis bifunctional protein